MSSTAFALWYEANKEAFNARRRQKYKDNAEAREITLKRQREYKARNPRAVSDGRQFRLVSGNSVEVFRIGTVSEHIGRSICMIRIWERHGKIPKPSISGRHRVYTATQVKLLKEFSELMDQIRYDPSIRNRGIEAKSAEIHSLWECL